MEFYKSGGYENVRSIFDYAEKSYLKSYSWDITKSPETLHHDDGQLVEQNEWDKVHNTDFNTSYVMIPLSRYYEVMEILPIGNELSLKKVVDKIYEFYQKPLTNEQIERVKLYPRVGCGYIEDLLKKASIGEKVCYADLRGDCVHFEGIKRIQANVYELRLGS